MLLIFSVTVLLAELSTYCIVSGCANSQTKLILFLQPQHFENDFFPSLLLNETNENILPTVLHQFTLPTHAYGAICILGDTET